MNALYPVSKLSGICLSWLHTTQRFEYIESKDKSEYECKQSVVTCLDLEMKDVEITDVNVMMCNVTPLLK